MTPIAIRGLTKRFGQTVAVDAIDLNIDAGDLFFLLGPSGCGKTTLLRMLAGLSSPDAGSIHFGNHDITHDPPNRRDTGMVFQGYALWPHMTVAQNVEFGLTVGPRKNHFTPSQRRDKVENALALTQIRSLDKRKPNQLSGGQQQRVALSRALVIEPAVLLLDEPLSNLDAKLRLQMRSQIRQICKNAGITAVYVTHDQKEALSMADKIAVLRHGQVMQVGPPRLLYARPTNRFVADFLGETNFVSAKVKSQNGNRILLESPAGLLESTTYPENLPGTGNVTCSIRPETLRVAHQSDPIDLNQANCFAATQSEVVYLGEIAQYQLIVGDSLQLKVFELNPTLTNRNATLLHISVAPEDVVILCD